MPDRSHRLQLAFSLGREAASSAGNESEAEAPPCPLPPLLAIGVITAPANAVRRTRMRRARSRLLRDRLCACTFGFVLGRREWIEHSLRPVLQAEQASHADLIHVRAHDGLAGSHGGRAVAEKALAWFVYAAKHSRAQFVGKLDDDTMPNLPRLLAELTALPDPHSAYYGVHVYRLWEWSKQPSSPNAACGGHYDDGPPNHSRSSALSQLSLSKRSGECAKASGPYPFPDGSLEVVGKGLLSSVFGCARVRDFAEAEYARRGPPFWTHEDAALGALVHREVEDRGLSVTYVALRRWEHNRFWVNWADLSTLIDGNVHPHALRLAQSPLTPHT